MIPSATPATSRSDFAASTRAPPGICAISEMMPPIESTSPIWTQVDIGLVLSIGGIISLIAQMPGGALVDAAKSERLVAGVALVIIATSATAYALMPIFPVVLSAAAAHALASCVLGPCIVAISLGLVGHAAIGERLGRNG